MTFRQVHPRFIGVGLVGLFGVLLCLLAFQFDGHAGFNLWDEGFLWYGVQRVLQGEMPVRDFMSYDPGRYYWAAGWLALFHTHGIVAVRAATAAFSALGVVAAGILVWRALGGRMLVRFGISAFAMLLCLLWMVPWWKSYDAAISVILTASLTRVLALPSARRFLVHGFVVGMAAVVGRNHGVYGVVACVLALPLLALATKPAWRRCIPAWALGVVLGFSPILLMMAFDHRFSANLWGTIRFMLFEYKGTNLPVPVPWPWKVPIAHEPLQAIIRAWLVGCCFVALPLYCVAGAVLLARRVRATGALAYPAFAACVITAIPYLNVAFSRADVSHLAQASLPGLLGLVVWPWRDQVRSIMRSLVLPGLTVVTLMVTLPLHPGYSMRTDADWRAVDVRGDRLWMSASAAASVTDIKDLAHRYVSPGKTILSAPVWPGAYALLHLKSPVYEIYPLFPRNDTFQNQEIARLHQAAPQLVLIDDIAVDGRNDLRYAHTHPLIWRYITMHFHRIPAPAKEPQLKVYLPGKAN